MLVTESLVSASTEIATQSHTVQKNVQQWGYSVKVLKGFPTENISRDFYHIHPPVPTEATAVMVRKSITPWLAAETVNVTHRVLVWKP